MDSGQATALGGGAEALRPADTDHAQGNGIRRPGMDRQRLSGEPRVRLAESKPRVHVRDWVDVLERGAQRVRGRRLGLAALVAGTGGRAWNVVVSRLAAAGRLIGAADAGVGPRRREGPSNGGRERLQQEHRDDEQPREHGTHGSRADRARSSAHAVSKKKAQGLTPWASFHSGDSRGKLSPWPSSRPSCGRRRGCRRT